jgi:hypothetical protein
MSRVGCTVLFCGSAGRGVERRTTVRQPVSLGRVAALVTVFPGAGAMAPSASSRSTRGPGTRRVKPSSSSNWSASEAVCLATPRSSTSEVIDGTASPGARSPDSIRPRSRPRSARTGERASTAKRSGCSRYHQSFVTVTMRPTVGPRLLPASCPGVTPIERWHRRAESHSQGLAVCEAHDCSGVR